MLVCLVTMACCGDVRRKAPMNFIFLGLFTLAESFLLGCAVATFRAQEILLLSSIITIITFSFNDNQHDDLDGRRNKVS
uniref:Putative n-methyl-d-aspartate receptor glutamate-binding subunit n=1 Tax=Panstrongylus lignarius TaxID=156445 RepID=A0A224Y5A0_9HEMI